MIVPLRRSFFAYRPVKCKPARAIVARIERSEIRARMTRAQYGACMWPPARALHPGYYGDPNS